MNVRESFLDGHGLGEGMAVCFYITGRRYPFEKQIQQVTTNLNVRRRPMYPLR